jgi:hypothetical protein
MCVYKALIPFDETVTVAYNHLYDITTYFIYYNRLRRVMYLLSWLEHAGNVL